RRNLQSLLSCEGSQRSRIGLLERNDQDWGNGCRQYLPRVYCSEVDTESPASRPSATLAERRGRTQCAAPGPPVPVLNFRVKKTNGAARSSRENQEMPLAAESFAPIALLRGLP